MLLLSEPWIRFFLPLGKVASNQKTSHRRAASPLHAMWIAFKVATGTR
jgi:hypothetical protein